jgi:hypothetical protein
MHPMQDLFLESFSYELQLDMHSYLHKNFILAKSGCYTLLVGFSDANFAGCGIDCKSIFGTCHFLGSSLVCWSSQKQYLVIQSTTEVEYVAAALKSYGLCTP